MSKAIIVEYYEELPPISPGRRDAKGWASRLQGALNKYRDQVGGRYSEGTLQRLLSSSAPAPRRAAVLALGLLGGMRSNAVLAGLLRDSDRIVRNLAVDALWSIWFRANNEENHQELRRLIRMDDPREAVAGLSALIQRHPDFAEAYNQRAILYFKLEQYQMAIVDCERTLKLNPFHFGAMAGLGQAYMKLMKPRAALKAFRSALRIHPSLEGIQETIHFLEEALGEEGKK